MHVIVPEWDRSRPTMMYPSPSPSSPSSSSPSPGSKSMPSSFSIPVYLRLQPVLSGQQLLKSVEEPSVRALVLEGYGAGNIPGRLEDSIKRLLGDGSAVDITVCVTQCPYGHTASGYATGANNIATVHHLQRQHPFFMDVKVRVPVITVLGSMTTTATFVKAFSILNAVSLANSVSLVHLIDWDRAENEKVVVYGSGNNRDVWLRHIAAQSDEDVEPRVRGVLRQIWMAQMMTTNLRGELLDTTNTAM